MTYVHNGEIGFKDEFLDGLTAAYGRYLRRVAGASGVISVSAPSPGRASVLIGGGAGHYPAFAGLVGPGLCDGAVVGDVFTSPSAEHVYRCIRALDAGAGVLMSFGNYSGDVMHFGAAAERARAAGIDARIVLVTDDVASAPRQRWEQRRGIAGGFFVFRAAAAAAHAGYSIDDLEAIARRVNAATFTFGVAFSGCTFPGRAEPLFTVGAKQMELGLGIHGEPGIKSVEWMPAQQLGELMTQPLLVERPPGADRALVLLNGLGSTKYEELFVLYRTIDKIMRREGVEVVRPEVGEYVTSLDMAGCSLTLCWLDEEIEPLLDAPAAAPGYRTSGALPGWTAPAAAHPQVAAGDPQQLDPPAALAPKGPRTACAETVTAMIAAMRDAIEAIEADLGRLDSVAGDGDHGAGMVRGLRAACSAATVAGPRAADVLKAAGIAFSEAAGGASGALWGAALHEAGTALDAMNEPEVDFDDELSTVRVHHALVAALAAVTRLGGAEIGDKTLVDALVPFVDAFAAAGNVPVPRAWAAASAVARDAAAATANLEGRKGRSAVHGARSRGTPDPGAVSMAAALTAALAALDRA